MFRDDLHLQRRRLVLAALLYTALLRYRNAKIRDHGEEDFHTAEKKSGVPTRRIWSDGFAIRRGMLQPLRWGARRVRAQIFTVRVQMFSLSAVGPQGLHPKYPFGAISRINR